MKRFALSLMMILLALSLSAIDSEAAEKKKKKKKKGKPVNVEAMWKRVPATDPAPNTVFKVVDSLEGVHPRLFFTSEEMQKLVAASKGDALLTDMVERTLRLGDGLSVDSKAVSKMFGGASMAVVHALRAYPMVPLAYMIEPTEERKERVKKLLWVMIDQPNWEKSGEADSGMGASCIMLCAAICFDTIYNELTVEERKKAADRLLLQARRMYYLGHQRKSDAKNFYWQNDPANNHRWFRNKGLVSCLLAIMDEPGINADAMVEIAKKEMDYVVEWFPHDGDCHESIGYHNFGFAHLAMAVRMMDRVLGTDYQKHKGFENAWTSMVYSWDLKSKANLSYGDSKNNTKVSWQKRGALFIGPAMSRDSRVQAILTKYYHDVVTETESAWMTLPFYDPTVPSDGKLEDLPTSRVFGDLGLAYMRSSWTEDSPLMMFKCGPVGGYNLNKFRHSTKKPTYINVAHNDPDANTFAIMMNGDHVVHPSFYDMPKWTANHNTILVDGKGQLGEGKGWLQPIKGKDMRELSYLTTWKLLDNGVTAMEGEAGNAYPALDRFRRCTIWLPNEYVLILDDLASDAQRELSWVLNSRGAEVKNAEEGKAEISAKNGTTLNYQVKATQSLSASVEDYLFESPKGNNRLKQTRFSAQAQNLTIAAVFDVWGNGVKILELSSTGEGYRIVVEHNGAKDTWLWSPSVDLKTPSDLTSNRGGQEIISFSKNDKAPLE